ncbi:MAG: hypothetical protein ACT452_20275 [Microthrixaceae bacterium]
MGGADAITQGPVGVPPAERRLIRWARRRSSGALDAMSLRVAGSRHQRSRSSALVEHEGGGGPLLVVIDRGGFSRYLVEILRAEGLSAFRVVGPSDLSAELLRGHDVVMLGPIALPDSTVAMLEAWVEAGGGLVAIRPCGALGPLLGIQPDGRVQTGGYLVVDATAAPATGICRRPMQIHAPADHHRVTDAHIVAELCDQRRTPTGAPAVTVRQVGGNGGAAGAFTYDLALSIVQTRQGNLAWSGQNRDGDLLTRSNDLFHGGATDDPQPDWVDGDLLDVPQADEQQRLLVQLLQHVGAGGRPLPRFWYLPRGLRAAVVMTGDDHAFNGTADRFRAYEALDGPDDTVEDWTAVRATSYLYPHGTLSDAEAAAFEAQGFEIAPHVTTGAREWTTASLARAFRRQLAQFRARYPSLEPPRTHRTHAVVWSDWASQPEVERSNGIRLDTNYYLYPAPSARGRCRYFTGSGLPMRFATAQGEVIDCYQAVTLLTDESGQEFPDAIEEALDRVLHPEHGHVAVLTANMHTDIAPSIGSDAIVAAARQRGVPIISARQLLTWLDARTAAHVSAIERTATGVRFAISAPAAARHLELVLPVPPAWSGVRTISRDGNPVAFAHERIGAVTHVRLPAMTGAHEVEWADSADAPPLTTTSTHAPRPRHRTAISHRGIDQLTSGTCQDVMVTAALGGALILQPGVALEPGTDLGTAWERLGATYERSDDGDEITLVGALLAAELSGAPSSFEAGARLSGAEDQIGFADARGEPAAAFVTTDEGELIALVQGVDRRVVVPIPGQWCEREHRFRIDWDEGLSTFSIDRRAVASVRARVGGPVRPMVSSVARGGPLAIRWARGAGFPATGSYTSEVLDHGSHARWGRVTLSAPALTLTGARAAWRSGDVAIPDPSWSAWEHCGPMSSTSETKGRFLQYRVELITGSPLWTPEITGVTVDIEP